jgi:prepilin-type N-terminal cleavage/methylation domain-containing protein
MTPTFPFSLFAVPSKRLKYTFHPRTPANQASHSRAFTLIELMVAAAITTLLLMGMTGIFDQAMKAWRLSARRGDAEREVRAALATLERDLKSLIVTNTIPIYVGVTDTTLVGISSTNRNNLAPTNATGTWTNVSTVLFFGTTQGRDSGNSGNISGVGYYVAWSPTENGGRGAYNLYRYYQTPSNFFNAMTNFLVTSNRLYQTNNLDEIVGANVLNFWAQLVVVPQGILANPSNMPSSGMVTNRPSYVQMELTAYSSEAVRGFTQADWGNTNNIRRFGRSFIWRVDL